MLDAKLKKERQKEDEEIKLLLLGAHARARACVRACFHARMHEQRRWGVRKEHDLQTATDHQQRCNSTITHSPKMTDMFYTDYHTIKTHTTPLEFPEIAKPIPLIILL